MNNIIFLTLFLFFSLSVRAQTSPEQIIAASPSQKNIMLIDTLLSVSRFDKYFVFYCNKKIDISATSNKWDSTEIQRRKSKVNFADFKDYTIYNAFAFLTTKELQQFIAFCENSEKPNTIPALILEKYPQIRDNLILFVKRYLE